MGGIIIKPSFSSSSSLFDRSMTPFAFCFVFPSVSLPISSVGLLHIHLAFMNVYTLAMIKVFVLTLRRIIRITTTTLHDPVSIYVTYKAF